MENQRMEEMMLKFLARYYPISRHKIRDRFKRGILFDNGHIYQISDKKEMHQAYTKLIEVLQHVFKCNVDTCKSVLSQVL